MRGVKVLYHNFSIKLLTNNIALCKLFYVHGHTHLERLVIQVHLEQRVSHQVSEATAVEITVWPRVTSAIVDLRELQATKVVEVVSVEILVLAEHLLTKRGTTSLLGYSHSQFNKFQ